MLRRLIEARAVACYCVAALVWTAGWFLMPFPESHPLLVYVHFKRPAVYHVFYWSYLAMWFTTPWFLASMLLSLLYIFTGRRDHGGRGGRLPRYPEPAGRSSLLVYVGEIHHPKRPIASKSPRWLSIPERGLYTGIAVFGAIGSGKTSCCMYPFAEQILAYCHDNPERRIGGLVLEVKGDFCHKVRHILAKHGRESDFVEMSLDSPYRYNPFENDLEAYALAYGIASLLNNLYGPGQGALLAAGLHEPREVRHPASQSALRVRHSLRCLRVLDQSRPSGAEDRRRQVEVRALRADFCRDGTVI
jgi:hypothetical protein